VLTAFQQVEDQLAALRVLEQQAAVEADAVRAGAARPSGSSSTSTRRARSTYTSVITAQTSALANEQTALAVPPEPAASPASR
jgi:outer membrane protein TolC